MLNTTTIEITLTGTEKETIRRIEEEFSKYIPQLKDFIDNDGKVIFQYTDKNHPTLNNQFRIPFSIFIKFIRMIANQPESSNSEED